MPLIRSISFTELFNQKQNPASKDCPEHEQSRSSKNCLSVAAILTILAILIMILAILTLILAILAYSAYNWPILTVADSYHGSAAGYKMERNRKKEKINPDS